MRHTLRATRRNPIEQDATSELISYVKKEGGFLRVEYTNAAGQKVAALLRPEGVGTKNGNTFLVGTDFRDVNDQPMGLDPKERRSINIAKIDTMAYRAEKDVDPIVTGLGGAFAFLNWRYRVPGGITLKGETFPSIHDALQKIAFVPEDAKDKSSRGKQKLVTAPSWEDEDGAEPSKAAVAVVEKLLRKKFESPALRRWLVSTGNRPFLLDSVPENAPEMLQVDQNPMLEAIRAEAQGAGVQPTAPMPSRDPVVGSTTSILSEEGYAEAQAALDSLRASTMQRSLWALMHKAGDTPELVPVAVEEFRRDSRPAVDAVIYIQSIRDSSNTPDKVFALMDPPIPYIVLKQPANLLDESGVNRTLKWLAEHPDWQRIGIAMVTTDLSRKQITEETLLYRDMLKAGLMDPELREAAEAKVELRYTNEGDVKSPISGEVVSVRPIATGYEVTVAVPAPLRRGLGKLVHVSRTALNAVLIELEDVDSQVADLQYAHQRAKNSPNFDQVGRAGTEVRAKARNLEKKLKPRLEAAQRRSEIVGGLADPITSLKQELLDLKEAKNAVMAGLDLLSDYVRYLRQLQEIEGLHLSESPLAADKRVVDLNFRLADINRRIENIPPELRSDSKVDNLRGLAKLYPGVTPGAKYEMVGNELYLYEYLKFPQGRAPLNLKPGSILWRGETIILAGKRTDVAGPRVDKLAVTNAYLISQARGINCAPVSVHSFQFPRITDRDVLAETLNDLFYEHSNVLRFDAMRALAKVGEETLKKISAKLTAANEYNYIENCDDEKGASFVVDPVFYCILYDAQTGDVWLPPMGSIVPGHANSEEHQQFVDTASAAPAFGPALVAEALTKSIPFMSDIPLDVNKPKLLWRPKGDYAMAIRKILVERPELVQEPGFFEYQRNYFPTGKGAREAKKAGEKLSAQLATVGTYRALGTAGAVLGAEGKMYASKTSAPKLPASGDSPSVRTLTYGKQVTDVAPRKYAVESAEGKESAGLTIVGVRGGKDAPVQQLRMAPAASRFDRYMEQLVRLQKEVAPTARQIAMDKPKPGQEKPDEKEGTLMIERKNPEPPDELPDFLPEDTEEPIEVYAEAPAAPKAAAASSAASPFSRTTAAAGGGRELSQSAALIETQRSLVQQKWAAFNDALRAKTRVKSEELKELQNAYLDQLGTLESLLSKRDEATLKAGGFDALQMQLRNESATWAEATRGAYAPSARGAKTAPLAAQRLRFARDMAGLVDAFGRPVAPPSDEEMKAHGLGPLDLSVSAVKPGGFSRAQKRPLDYTMLVKAAEIAAAASKRKPEGISASAVSCRVMGGKSVAYPLANDPNGGQYHQLLFRRFGASLETQKFKTILLWYSPLGDHIIFYVNGFPTCEFHIKTTAQHPNGDHIGLLLAVLRYTEDWFNDPREFEKRKTYRVLIGQSGSPKLYQIWGAKKTGSGSGKKEVGPFLANVVQERMYDYELPGMNGGLSDKNKAESGVTKTWVTPELAGKYGTTPTKIINAERDAYIRAVAKVFDKNVPSSFAMLTGDASALRSGMISQAVSEVTAALAKGTNTYTLYYPPLYSEEGVMDRTTNEGTAAELKAQLDNLADKAPTGAEFTIIDGSLFRVGTFKSSLFDFDNYRSNMVFVKRPTSEGIAYQIVPPYIYLRDRFAANQKKVKITVVCPLPQSVREDEVMSDKMDELTAQSGIIFKPAATGGAVVSLGKDFAHGSSLVLWNDPDTPNASKFFGMSNGITYIATLAADNIGLLRRIVVESSGYSEEVKQKVPVTVASRLKPEGVEAEIKTSRTFTLPQVIREVTIKLLADKIKAGVSAGAPLASVLGLPSELAVAAQAAAKTTDPTLIAESVLDILSEEYGNKPDTYFKYGFRYDYAQEMDIARERRGSGFGEAPTRENRNRTREQVASRYLRR